MMSTLGMAQVPTGGLPAERAAHPSDARAWELLQEVVEGKLDIQTLCERHRMHLDEVQGWLRERHRDAITAFDAQLKRALIRQGASPEALVSPELSMSLDDVSILDWIQAIQIFAKEAVITLLHGDGESRIWCSQGAVVDASSGRLRGEAAFYRIAAIERGQVVTELRPVQRERTIRTSPTSLLLEAARRKDERALLESRVGGLDRVVQCAGKAALTRSLNTAQAAMLRLFDQPRRLGDVLSESDIGDIETLAALDGLIRSGQLVEAPPSSVEARMSRPPRSELTRVVDSSSVPIAFAWPQARAPRSSSWRWAASTLVMGVLVAGAAWLGTQASIAKLPAPVAAEPAVAIPTAYSVAVRTDPVDADLRVDGRKVARGAWMATLPRDGVAHELTVSADGFVPVRILFVDTPPPPHVRLERLPSREAVATAAAPLVDSSAAGAEQPAAAAPSAGPSSAGPSSAGPSSAGTSSGVPSDAATRRRVWAQRRERLARSSGDRAGAGEPASTATPAAAKKKPFVQIIDGESQQNPTN